MNIGETDPSLRRIYSTIYADDGITLSTTAASSPPSGTVKTTVNGAAFANAPGTLVHVGSGLYYYEATSGEVATGGFLSVKYERAGFTKTHFWAPVGQLWSIGEVDTSLLRLPLTIYDTATEPPALATGATVTTAADLKVSHNGAAYANATGSLVEVGDGLYYYQGVTGDAAVGGALLVKYESAGFGVAITWTSVDPSLAGSVVTAPVFTSVTTPGSLGDNPDVTRWIPIALTFDVPPGYQVVIVAQIGIDSALWMAAYDESIGGAQGAVSLAPLYADKSVIQITGTIVSGRVFTASILPNGGWQREQVSLVVYIALEVTE
jgi:hypothetical protein